MQMIACQQIAETKPEWADSFADIACHKSSPNMPCQGSSDNAGRSID